MIWHQTSKSEFDTKPSMSLIKMVLHGSEFSILFNTPQHKLIKTAVTLPTV